MIRRHQLAVAPRVRLSSLVRASVAPQVVTAVLQAKLRDEFSASACVLTDSGTSALVLALRLLLPRGGIVGLPSYGCVDITSAVKYAGLRARLYDVDPATLSPEIDSVRGVLERGVNALLVAHFYGYPANLPAVRSLASEYNVPILEDAAQASGGYLKGQRLGALGDLSILSFGRGKGLFGGKGGALLVRSEEWTRRLSESSALGGRHGIGELVAAAGQWALGRPQLYAIPASIPSLRLGDMVYHPAREPMSLSRIAASLTLSALENERPDRESRVRKAGVLQMLASVANHLAPIQPIDGAQPGYLRFAVIDRSGWRRAASRLGVMPGYPRTLREQIELVPHLMPGEPPTPGATELRDSLFTLPTHAFVSRADVVRLQDWMNGDAKPRPELAIAHSRREVETAVVEGWGR